MRSTTFIALTLLLTASSTVDAQHANPRGYLQGAMVLTVQPEGDISVHSRISPPLGGAALGAAASAGYFITPALRQLLLQGRDALLLRSKRIVCSHYELPDV
jgi:hypothetical protein